MKRTILLALLCTFAASANAQNDPSSTVGSTGTVTFNYGTDSVVYTTVRAADGMIWLQQNLGATQVATFNNDFAAYGDKFQWGRWTDGHQVLNGPVANSSTINPNDPSGIPSGNPNFLVDWWGGGTNADTWTDAMPSATNGTDPCTAIGPGWHTPSSSEFTGVVAAEGITDDITAFNSNLKIVVAGFRSSDMGGGYTNGGVTGYYWTSNAANGQFAQFIGFVPLTILPPQPTSRSSGLSMRCLTNCTGVFPPDDVLGEDTVCEGSTQTYYVDPVDNADTYTWTVPTGWTIIGANNTTVLTVVTGSTGGMVTAQAINTCNDASTSLNVVVNPLPVPVIMANDNVLSTGTFTSYQWMVNDTIINGATTNPYTATEGGDYQVIVTDANGCSDTSVVFAHTLGVNNVNTAAQIKMYPNPAVNVLHIAAPMNVNVNIYSIDGRMVMSEMNATNVDISALPSGTYHVKMTDKDGVTVKMEKLTVLRQ